jgi:hypothetical protein
VAGPTRGAVASSAPPTVEGMRWGAIAMRGLGPAPGATARAARLEDELMELERCGWLVCADVPTDVCGEIDFLVSSPATSFLVDLACPGRHGEARARTRLEAHERWARERYGPGRPIVAVLCVEDQAPAGGGSLHRVAGAELRGFLLDRG